MSNLQHFVWSILYSFHLAVQGSCELRSIKYAIEKTYRFDLIGFFVRTKQMIATTESVSPEVLLLDQVWVPLKELTQVLASIFQKMLVKKTHLLTLLQSRSKDNGLVAADICAILMVDFVKCRDKCGDMFDLIASFSMQKLKEAKNSFNQSRSVSKTRKNTIGITQKSITQVDSVKNRMSKSIMKTNQDYSSPYKMQKTSVTKLGRSLTPAKTTKKVTLNMTGTTHEEPSEKLRTTLGELTLNRDKNDHYMTMLTKPRCGGGKGSKKTKSVFLQQEYSDDGETRRLADALVVKDKMEYHLQESVPRYDEYQKQMLVKKKKADIFKDKQAMM